MAVERELDLVGFAEDVGRQMVVLLSADVNNFARRNVRVDTGRLRNSIRTDIISRDERQVSAETPYAAAQEFGRPDIPNYGFTPYARPAAREATTDQNLRRRADEAVRFARQRNRV